MQKKELVICCILILAVLITAPGCGDNDPDFRYWKFQVAITNLTYDQPFSPLAVLLHIQGFSAWTIGTSASHGLEVLAEGGNPSVFLNDSLAVPEVISTAAANGIALPGGSVSVDVDITTRGGQVPMLTSATMLVNTNDAFAGVKNIALNRLMVGEKMVLMAPAYDAGTEANSETAATVPGPAAGGEGYNAARDDTGFVSIHSGVVSMDDGLALSALTQAHRWDNPVARIEVTRLD